ncbi:MAG TPA: S26 family signal peptidase [Patescibacteria group bacterium]|nr:S26 family signal peptidase [Patescibacteria group bacterium]
MILGKFKILGHSMQPKLREGSEVLVSSLPYVFSKPKIKDMVAFKYLNKVLIKRVIKTKGNQFLVEGDNIADSLRIGWIGKKDIIGKVIHTL